MTLSAGTKNSDGSWTLSPAQLSELTLTAGAATTASLVVTATNTEGTTASTSQTIPLTVTSDPPKLTVAVAGPVSWFWDLAIVTPADANDTVSLTVAGLPAGATLSALDNNNNFASLGINNGDGSWTLTESQASFVDPSPLFYRFSPSVTLPSGTAVADLVVTATETNPTTGVQTSSAPFSFELDPTAATSPQVMVDITQPGLPPFNMDEGATVPFDITVSPLDPNDSVTITGLPSDAMLSAGINNGGGSWTLNLGELVGLTLTAGEPTPTTPFSDSGVSGVTPTSVLVDVRVTPPISFASSGESFPLTVYAVAPTLTIAQPFVEARRGRPDRARYQRDAGRPGRPGCDQHHWGADG